MKEKEEINRIQVVLVEKKKRINGWQESWVKIPQLFRNGAQTLVNRG